MINDNKKLYTLTVLADANHNIARRTRMYMLRTQNSCQEANREIKPGKTALNFLFSASKSGLNLAVKVLKIFKSFLR